MAVNERAIARRSCLDRISMTVFQTPLVAGKVLRIETPSYEHGWAGLNGKETVLITGGDTRVPNRSRRGLVVPD